MAMKEGVELFSLPAHMTHILQPLNVGFFASLRNNWNIEQEQFCLSRAANGQFVTQEKFCEVLIPAWQQSLTPKDKDWNELETAGVPGIRNSFR